jgi:hypothetical protein
MIMQLGLEHEGIHCWLHGCALFEGDYEDLLLCPKCNTPRYVDNSNDVPKKVLRYFPVIPCLKRLCQCLEIATLM